VREFAEERAASKEAAASLKNTNKLLEGSSVAHFRCCTADLLVTAKLAELQSEHSAHPGATKKKLIPRPKGSGWILKTEMRLENDPGQYNQIIVRVPSSHFIN
jgi:hypothetical protein